MVKLDILIKMFYEDRYFFRLLVHDKFMYGLYSILSLTSAGRFYNSLALRAELGLMF